MESFDELSRELAEARESLRSFILGREGFTQQAGAAAISRVNSLCEQLRKGFGSGKYASAVTSTVGMARGQIQAAQARMALLQQIMAVTAPRNGQKR